MKHIRSISIAGIGIAAAGLTVAVVADQLAYAFAFCTAAEPLIYAAPFFTLGAMLAGGGIALMIAKE